MAKRLMKHSAILLGAVSIMDLSGRTAYRGLQRELERELPRASRRPAAARTADQMSAALSDRRRTLTAR